MRRGMRHRRCASKTGIGPAGHDSVFSPSPGTLGKVRILFYKNIERTSTCFAQPMTQPAIVSAGRDRAAVVQELRRLLPGTVELRTAVAFGLPVLDSCLPDGGLPCGALHEIVPQPHATPAALGFIAALLALRAGPCLSCGPRTIWNRARRRRAGASAPPRPHATASASSFVRDGTSVWNAAATAGRANGEWGA